MMMIKLSFVTVVVAIGVNPFGEDPENQDPSLKNIIYTEEQLIEKKKKERRAKAEAAKVGTPDALVEATISTVAPAETPKVPAVTIAEEAPEDIIETGISCGSHTAPTCKQCLDKATKDEKITNKEGFCNGVCVYDHESEECIASDERVDCGHHQAASCDKCTTEKEGARFCHDDCTWSTGNNKCEASSSN